MDASFDGKRFQESEFVLDDGLSADARPDWAALGLSREHANALNMLQGQGDAQVQELLATGSNAADLGAAVLAAASTVTDAVALKSALRTAEQALRPNLAAHGPALFAAADKEVDLLTSSEEDAGQPQNNGKGAALEVRPFGKLLQHTDGMVKLRALYVLSMLLSLASGGSMDSEVEMAALNVVCDELVTRNVTQAGDLEAGLQALSLLLRSDHMRKMFDARAGVLMLLDVMETSFSKLSDNAQYALVLCSWLSCFCDSAAARVDQGGLSTLVRVLRTEPRLRVTRLVLSTIRIALSRDPDAEQALCEAVIEAKLPKLLSQLASKKSSNNDKELLDDLEWLQDTLSRNFKVLSSFERHAQELLTRKLTKNMLHEELFWRENALKFESNNFRSVKALIELLASDDDETVALACSDLGYFVQYFPSGRTIVETNNGKAAIMGLLSHDNPEVQKQALVACSKIMVTNWESIRT